MKKGKTLLGLLAFACVAAGCGKLVKDYIVSKEKDTAIDTSWTEIDIEASDDKEDDEGDTELS